VYADTMIIHAESGRSDPLPVGSQHGAG